MIRIQPVSHDFCFYLLKHNFWRETYDVLLINNPGDFYKQVEFISNKAKLCQVVEFHDKHLFSEKTDFCSESNIIEVLEWFDYWRENRKSDDNPLLMVACTSGVFCSPAFAFVLASSIWDIEESADKLWNHRLHVPSKNIIELGANVLKKPEMVSVLKKFLETYKTRNNLTDVSRKDFF